MYRITKMGYNWFAIEFNSVYSEADNITDLVESGDTVLIAADLDMAAELLEIERDDITVVEGDDE